MLIRQNQNSKIAKEIRQKIRENGNYCLTQAEKTENNQCICEYFRDMVNTGKSGFCPCGLYEIIL